MNAIARLRVRITHEGVLIDPTDLNDALFTSGIVASGGSDEMHLPLALEHVLLINVASASSLVCVNLLNLSPPLAEWFGVPIYHRLWRDTKPMRSWHGLEFLQLLMACPICVDSSLVLYARKFLHIKISIRPNGARSVW